MGIKLDWQVESEQTEVRATDDPEARRRRQQAQRRLVLLIAGLAGVLTLIVGLVYWRLRHVDNQLRQDLLDTVEIEVTALRLGDFANFMAIQRSASETFLLEQSREFERYQALKQARRVDLTGDVLDVEINDQRGRVVLQENIDGVAYKVVWFYWHYEDSTESSQGGWRRVPDDLTFWGDEARIEADNVTITYRALDADLARALAERLPGWWAQGCQQLGCATPPPSLHVEIVPEQPAGSLTWRTPEGWTLRIASPLVERTRADVPIAPELERAIAEQVAERLVQYAAGDTVPGPRSDNAWLRSELAIWLAGLVLSDPGAEGFVNSLIAYYGAGVPQIILRALHPTVTLDEAFTAVAGMTAAALGVEQLNALDWSAFFQWRLDAEWELLSQPDSNGALLALYDMDNPIRCGRSRSPPRRSGPGRDVDPAGGHRDHHARCVFADLRLRGYDPHAGRRHHRQRRDDYLAFRRRHLETLKLKTFTTESTESTEKNIRKSRRKNERSSLYLIFSPRPLRLCGSLFISLYISVLSVPSVVQALFSHCNLRVTAPRQGKTERA